MPSLVPRSFPSPAFDHSQAIKNWSRGRPGNEANRWQLFLEPGQLTWLHMHGLNFKLNHELNFWCSWVPFMHGLLPEVTQSTTVYIKFRPPVSGLPLSVEAQISATQASTSVVFASGPQYCTLTVTFHWPHMVHVNLREIFECAHLKFTVSGQSKQASIHTRAQCSHASVGLAQSRPNNFLSLHRIWVITVVIKHKLTLAEWCFSRPTTPSQTFSNTITTSQYKALFTLVCSCWI